MKKENKNLPGVGDGVHYCPPKGEKAFGQAKVLPAIMTEVHSAQVVNLTVFLNGDGNPVHLTTVRKMSATVKENCWCFR